MATGGDSTQARDDWLLEATTELENATNQLLQSSIKLTLQVAAKILAKRQAEDDISAWLIEEAIPAAVETGSEFSLIALAAPDRSLICKLIKRLKLDHEAKTNEFSSCAWRSGPAISLDFMKWLAEVFQFESCPPIIDGECHAFANACVTGKYEIAMWMYFEFNLLENCNLDFLLEVGRSLEQAAEKMSKEGKQDVAEWIRGLPKGFPKGLPKV